MKHRLFYKWHIWLGWLIGVPLILWTASGLFMVARPIEEVRGTHLRAEAESLVLSYENIVLFADNGNDVTGAKLIQQAEMPVWIVTYASGDTARYSATSGAVLPFVTRDTAREAAERLYLPDEEIVSTRLFAADASPADLRREIPSWQVRFADGTNVYINADTGEALAVRTRFWRAFDFMWGLHIMDLQTREDTSHPILIGSAALALFGSMIGFVMLFTRRRKRRSQTGGAAT
ncbi:MAG: PepSY domain-containing protein [Pseudomonadota bacterium]